jgi:hypothetical protein
MPKIRHNLCVNLDAKRGSRSLMIRDGSLNLVNTCQMYSPAISSAVISSRHGMKIAALVQSWSTTVRMESLPSDSGSFVMKSSAIVSNGSASGFG